MIGPVLSLAAAGAKAAAAIAEKAKNGQLIEAGEAKYAAEQAERLYAELNKIKEARDTIDTDPAYAKRVLEAATRESGETET